VQQLELADIQALLRHGYPYFNSVTYFLMRIDDPVAAADWLEELHRDWIDSAKIHARELLDRTADDRCGVAIAFTPSGLRQLGLSAEAMETFVSEFQQGIAAPQRSRALGDVANNSPAGWKWGKPGDNAERIDVLLMVFARPDDLKTCDYVAQIRQIRGCPYVVHELHGTRGDSEPFGFVDGISQPYIEGFDSHSVRSGDGEVPVRAGEFVLGYLNEFDERPASPSVRMTEDPQRMLPFCKDGRSDLGRNGTFLVLRQLRQDVEAFNKLVANDPRLAARMVGRWPSGASLVQYPKEDPRPRQPGQGHPGARGALAQLEAENHFGYQRDDRHGFRCPIGAHVRRANPRDSLADDDTDPQEAEALVRRHRILRRGRRYKDDDGYEGILFMALNANIERQFEFVQQNWILSREFDSLHDESDPLLGSENSGATRTMTIQKPWRNECVQGLAQFVTVKGGGYFFLPGLTALKYLAAKASGRNA